MRLNYFKSLTINNSLSKSGINLKYCPLCHSKESTQSSLHEYYKDLSTFRLCPIFKSFLKFTSDWERELESLTS